MGTRTLDHTEPGVGAGNCLLCRHVLEGCDRIYCQLYGQWILSPRLDGADCPSFDAAWQGDGDAR